MEHLHDIPILGLFVDLVFGFVKGLDGFGIVFQAEDDVFLIPGGLSPDFDFDAAVGLVLQRIAAASLLGVDIVRAVHFGLGVFAGDKIPDFAVAQNQPEVAGIRTEGGFQA
ncbi:MAG: hypothetical protein PHI35_04300, partial [Victivallaceae bacterium]|nr:hypothetical protein [Victivallaceae bacterium]